MKLKEFVPSLLLTGTMLTLLITPALSQEKSSIAVEENTASTQKSTRYIQQASLVSNSPVRETHNRDFGDSRIWSVHPGALKCYWCSHQPHKNHPHQKSYK